eukprot:GAHX01001166.1.p1 GENE.GAHX01001166.1~~GAHX01001166.1.p1  ORF type:complete len:359 (+),score=61.48 GAHX01001166.1:37-1077(+)
MKILFYGLICSYLLTLKTPNKVLTLKLNKDKFKPTITEKLFSKDFEFIVDTGSPFVVLSTNIKGLTPISHPDYQELPPELNCRVCYHNACCLSLNFVQTTIPVIVSSINNAHLFGLTFPVLYFLLPLRPLPGNLKDLSILGIGSTYSSSTNPFGVLNFNEQLKKRSVTKIILKPSPKPTRQQKDPIKLKIEPNFPHNAFFSFATFLGAFPLTTYSNTFSPLIQVDTGASNICVNTQLLNVFYTIINNYCLIKGIKRVNINRNKGYISIEKKELKNFDLELIFLMENGKRFAVELKQAFVWVDDVDVYVLFVNECIGDVALLVGRDVLRNYNIEMEFKRNRMMLSSK